MTPETFAFCAPTPLIHGIGTSATLGQEARRLGIARALIVMDPGIVATGQVARLQGVLELEGIATRTFSEVQADPDAGHVEAAYPDTVVDVDGIVAIGGGSAIDTAKGLRPLAQFGGSLRDYGGVNRVPSPATMPLIALSTTAGTGSQVSFGAVFSDRSRKSKFPVISPHMCPTLAINDAALTVSAPPSVTARAGIDALAHAIESLVSRRANAMTRPYSLEAIRMIGVALPAVMARGSDRGARDAMLLASTMAIIPASNAGLGLAHAVAMPLCALYDLPHGLVVGSLLGHVMEFNLAAAARDYGAVALALGAQGDAAPGATGAERAAGWIRERAVEWGLAARLRDLDIRPRDFDFIAARTLESVQAAANPRTFTQGELVRWLETIH